MEEGRTGADVAPQPRASSSSLAITVPPEEVAPVSQRFRVELTPGETTIVSWRKLLRDGGGGGNCGSTSEVARPSGAHPALESRISPAVMAEQIMEAEAKDGQPLANRFSAVIEKIERLYMGKESSDEEVFGNAPDDDQYDTDDSFIDDAELNDYFQVDESKLKHNGFFINRGKLERLERSSSPNMAPTKRRRKDSIKTQSDQGYAPVLTEPVNIGNIRMKAAARNAPLVGKKLLSSTPVLRGETHQEAKVLKNKSSVISKTDKKTTDRTINLNASSSSKLQKKELALPTDVKDLEKQRDGLTQSRGVVNKSRAIGEAISLNSEVHHEKGSTFHIDSHFRKLPKDGYENETDTTKRIRYRDNNGIIELPDLNSPGTASIYPSQAEGEPKQVKEGCVIRPKGTALERAIRDLEKIVTESRPPHLQEADASQAVKKRLPAEIKQRLAKVARLADSQGKIASEQFLDRLMAILGHLLQPKSLKRHLKEMVELGLSVKQAKADKFQQIKKEVTEMIKMQVTSSKSKVPEQNAISSDDFQEASADTDRALKSISSLDYAIEDKICDLYDLYVEGMDEDRGPQARKLYVELAELWPAGYMDNLRIKDAVYRAKERKRALHKQRTKIQEDERVKRKRIYRTEEDTRLSSQTRVAQDRSAMDLAGQVNALSHRVSSSQVPSSSGRVFESIPSSNGLDDHHMPKHHDQIRGSIASIASDEGSKALIAIRKKIKRKADANAGAVHVHSAGIPFRQTDSKDKSQRASKASDGIPQVIALPSLGFQAPKQPN